MRRSLRYMALGVLTASLLSGNALTALADQDVNHGPGDVYKRQGNQLDDRQDLYFENHLFDQIAVFLKTARSCV